jgi:hypothetical protein
MFVKNQNFKHKYYQKWTTIERYYQRMNEMDIKSNENENVLTYIYIIIIFNFSGFRHQFTLNKLLSMSDCPIPGLIVVEFLVSFLYCTTNSHSEIPSLPASTQFRKSYV